ncbi:hypothetical protein C8R44DRAFT_754077 [Mycena epipterygia]|nr:hypothetical protein C8R44DRAFT_754077 [Mycena epipterygia]
MRRVDRAPAAWLGSGWCGGLLRGRGLGWRLEVKRLSASHEEIILLDIRAAFSLARTPRRIVLRLDAHQLRDLTSTELSDPREKDLDLARKGFAEVIDVSGKVQLRRSDDDLGEWGH